MLRWLVFIWIIFSITSKLINSESKNFTRIAPCRSCKIFVDSFKRGLERTAKFKFEGGDAAWEEERLGSYATSEVRFVEIQEHLCSEVGEGKEQCYNHLEEFDEPLEDWWFNKQTEEPDLFKYLCITTFEVCCPAMHYGRDCEPCPGYPDNICYKNGRCKGAGTRKGDGSCHCDPGYGGDFCNECASTHYVSYKDKNLLLCSECHDSCDGPCTKGGPKGCNACKPGWMMSKENGCLDLNECAGVRNPCSPLQFCVNTDGGYRCLDCDMSCAGCIGDGPDMCLNCAVGYHKYDNMCIDSTEESRRNLVFFTRYMTYIGLCIATCIILNKNTYMAAIVGSCVATYITISEFILNASPTNKTEIESQVAEQFLRSLN